MDGKLDARHERRFLLTLAGMQFTHILDFMIMAPLGAQLLRLLDIGTHDFAVLLSCYTFAAAGASLLAANFIGRFDVRKTFLLLYALFGLATLACALAQSFAFLLLARALAGAFGGMIEAMVHTMLAETIPFERRGAAVGVIYSAFSISTVIGVPLGLFLANALPQLSWHAPFFLLSGICLFCLLAAYLYLPQLIPDSMQQRMQGHSKMQVHDAAGAIWRQPCLRAALYFVVLTTCGGFLVMPYVPLYLTSNVGVAESLIPGIYLCAGIATLFSSRVIGKLADRHGKTDMFVYLTLASCVPLLLITQMTPVPYYLVLLNCTALFVLVPGRMIAGMAFLSSLPPAPVRASFMSLVAAAQMLSIGFSALLSGAMITRDLHGRVLHFAYAGYLAVACGMAAIYLLQRLKRLARLASYAGWK